MSAGHPRRWFQLSLRSLFLLVFTVAVFVAGFSLGERTAECEALRREKARENLRELGRKVRIHHDTTASRPSYAWIRNGG
jgi:hypothetical protein